MYYTRVTPTDGRGIADLSDYIDNQNQDAFVSTNSLKVGFVLDDLEAEADEWTDAELNTFDETVDPQNSILKIKVVDNDAAASVLDFNSSPFNIYPTIFSVHFFISGLTESKSSIDNLALYSLNGESIRISILRQDDEIKVTPHNHLSAGVYVLSFISNDEVYTGTIIKD